MTVSTVSRSEAGAARAASLTESGSATALPGGVEQDRAMPENHSGTDFERAQP
jgi:hypothetical protein